MAGYHLDFNNADIWYASVQKCFGLPSGMAILICSPKAVDRAKELNINQHYNDYSFILQNTLKHQTTHTPNILGIYLLYKLLADLPCIEKIHKKVLEKSKAWYTYLEEHPSLSPLISSNNVRSPTVIAVQSDVKAISSLLEECEKEGFLLGKGYGKWKKNTFRIANFPAIEKKEIELLKHFFNQ